MVSRSKVQWEHGESISAPTVWVVHQGGNVFICLIIGALPTVRARRVCGVPCFRLNERGPPPLSEQRLAGGAGGENREREARI